MRHISFYYAIGFVVTGFVMLVFTVMTLAAHALDPWNMSVLTLTTILPFVVSVLSWRDWVRLKRTTVASGER